MDHSHCSRIDLREGDLSTLAALHRGPILRVAKQHHVRIELPNEDQPELSIYGVNHLEALEAVKRLLNGETNEKRKSASPTLSETKAAAGSPLIGTSVTSSHYTFVKYSVAPVSKLDEKSISLWIKENLESFGGAVGGASIDVDVLVANVSESSFLLRVPSSGLIGLQSSLVLAQEYLGKRCAVELLAQSTCLGAIAAGNRHVALSDFTKDPIE